MNSFERQAAQGDILITRIDKMPAEVTTMDPEGGNYVCAHSETGHHHVVRASEAKAFQHTENPFIMYLMVDNAASIDHLRGFDTHGSLALTPGIYQINRQREYTPEGFRRAAD